MGFVLLACLNIFDYDDLHEANTVKNAFITVFSVIGAGILLTSGQMSWLHGLPIAIGTLFGGYGAVRIVRRFPEPIAPVCDPRVGDGSDRLLFFGVAVR